MKTRVVSLILLIAFAGCQKRQEAETTEIDRRAQPAETRAVLEAPRHAWDISVFGVRSTEFLLPYVTDCSADGGSHRYISKVASNGDVIRELLFIRSRSDQETMYEVYLLTYPNRNEKRRRLSTIEAEHEIKQIESDLTASGAKVQYDYFYAGGEMIENANIEDDDDPFSDNIPDKVDLDSEDVRRKMAEAFNQANLITIAELIRAYRRTIHQDEQAVDANLPFAPQPPSNSTR